MKRIQLEMGTRVIYYIFRILDVWQKDGERDTGSTESVSLLGLLLEGRLRTPEDPEEIRNGDFLLLPEEALVCDCALR